MELFAVVLSCPAALVATALYCLLLNKIIGVRPSVRALFLAVSRVILVLIAVEFVLFATAGAVRGREVIGPAFYPAHLVLFLLGTPALANVLVLRPDPGVFSRWYIVAPICSIFTVVLVLMQYHVTDSLYGPEGTEGPFAPQFSIETAKGGLTSVCS